MSVKVNEMDVDVSGMGVEDSGIWVLKTVLAGWV